MFELLGIANFLDFSDINPVNIALFLGFVVLAFLASWLAGYYQRKGTRIIYHRKIFFYFSGILILLLLIGVAVKGVKLGIDFKGGTLIQVGFKEEVKETQLRDLFSQLSKDLNKPNLSEAIIQEVKLANIKGFKKLYIIRTQPLDTKDDIPKIREALKKLNGEILKVESVGPTISKEIRRNALIALLIALAAQVVYIAFRFGSNIFYGIIADIALVHDVIVMFGFYVLAGKEIDSSFVAALLTVIGYSVMDSIVIFDRIRENLKKVVDSGKKDFDFEALVNESVNQTITRSVNTAISSLLPLIGIYFLGGETLKSFSFAIMVGFVSGAYSSIFIAAPLVVTLKKYILPAELRKIEEDKEIERQQKLMQAVSMTMPVQDNPSEVSAPEVEKASETSKPSKKVLKKKRRRAKPKKK